VSWLAYQGRLRSLVLGSEPTVADLAALGAEPARWRAYRRMVRARFLETLAHGFERLKSAIGSDRFEALADRFLAEGPPRSPYLRDVPGEFLRFLADQSSRLGRELRLPPYTLDLARYEWAELEAAYAFEEVNAAAVGPFDMQGIAVLTPAHRLLELDYPVHRWDAHGHDAAMAPEPVWLCLYRDAKTHEVTALELTPVTATMLELMQERAKSVTEVVRNAAERRGLTVNVEFIDALSTLLADLIERGVLLGCLIEEEKS
jgi:uncharacterized protein